ncbi:MAG: sigma-70 family RNA polymerase sigma factor [Deltaproteobacteria bacterium]|nr:MAG: sigma-70 family RNA polymerase sigma factor [Deltaproteobacteria bacterium]
MTTPSQLESREEDIQMVLAVREGDTTAYRGLVEKYQERIYHMVYGMLRNQEDARDITQDAFVKAYDNLQKFRLESSFYTWIYRIARNLTIDYLRKRKRRPETEFDEQVATRDERGGIDESHVQEGPGRTLERKRLYARIMTAMQQLPEDQREVVLLRELEGLSYKEIAEAMEIPEGTVMSRLYYARKKLQKLLAGERG